MSTITEKHWHAVYIKSRAEKKAHLELDLQGIEVYLPLHKKLRQWSDRKKWVEVPLISGYLFVHILPKEYDKVLNTNGVVSYVRFESKAAIIPEREIEAIKRLLEQSELEVEVNSQLFTKGDAIEVIAGPLMGIIGTLVTIKGKKRVAIQMNQLNISLVVELPMTDISKVK